MINKSIIKLISFIAGCFLILSIYKSGNNDELKKLINENKLLLSKNDSILKENISLKESIENSNKLIYSLNKKDELLKDKVYQLNNKIKIVKEEYEKAISEIVEFELPIAKWIDKDQMTEDEKMQISKERLKTFSEALSRAQ